MKGKKAQRKLERRQKDFDDNRLDERPPPGLKFHRPGSQNWNK